MTEEYIPIEERVAWSKRSAEALVKLIKRDAVVLATVAEIRAQCEEIDESLHDCPDFTWRNPGWAEKIGRLHWDFPDGDWNSGMILVFDPVHDTEFSALRKASELAAAS